MRARWRLLACVAVVLLVHAALALAWLHTAASGVPRQPPHQVAAVRMIVLGPVYEVRAASPEHREPGKDGDRKPTSAASAAEALLAVVPEPRAVARQSALSPERAASTPSSTRVPTVAPTRDFLSPLQVDRIAIAFPSPDVSSLASLNWSGIPMRLRLYITASGQCIDMQVLRANEDAGTLDHVRQMFLATHFIPARRAGADVDSYRDIELDVSDVK